MLMTRKMTLEETDEQTVGARGVKMCVLWIQGQFLKKMLATGRSKYLTIIATHLSNCLATHRSIPVCLFPCLTRIFIGLHRIV